MKRKCLLFILLFSVLHVTIVYSQSIHRLVKAEKVDSVKWILANQPELVNRQDALGRTPLMYCCEVKNEDLLAFFLKKGAKEGIKDNWGNDAINVASFNGYKKGVELLLKQGADVNSQNRWNIAPLHYAIRAHNDSLVRFLLRKGANTDLVSSWGTPLQVSIKRENTTVIKSLLNKGANPNKADDAGNTAVHTAIYKNNSDILTMLLQEEPGLRKSNALGYQPIHIAAVCGYSKMIKQLARKGVRLNTRDERGYDALYYAKYYHHPELIEYLKSQGMEEKNQQIALNHLQKPQNMGKANIFYLGHSGWAIETTSHYLLFDYYPYLELPESPSLYNGNVNVNELSDKPIMVFITHEHSDHYNPVIYDWKEVTSEITYIFGWDAHDKEPYICFDKPYMEKKIGGAVVRNIPCDDGGSAFHIQIDGLNIYHSGDYTGNMEKDMDYLAGFQDRVDIAFVGLGYREVTNYTLKRLQPKVAFPMHKRMREFGYHQLKEEINPLHPEVEIIPVDLKGDRYIYGF